MLKNLTALASLALVISIPAVGHAQALPTATGRGSLQAGVGYTYAKSDYGPNGIQGLSGFADFDFSLHLGVEAGFHYLAIITPNDIAENSYLIGPRYVYRHNRLNLYGKALFGVGDLVVQELQDNIGHPAGTFFAYGAGGGLDYQASKHLVIRAVDVEYQHWNYQTGLTPAVFTFGAAYRFR